MSEVAEEYRMTAAERFTFDLYALYRAAAFMPCDGQPRPRIRIAEEL
eukprot:COSAG02_NODE_8953_length_2384_cov_1.177243_2_plen_47_part_00